MSVFTLLFLILYSHNMSPDRHKYFDSDNAEFLVLFALGNTSSDGVKEKTVDLEAEISNSNPV